MVSAKLKSQSVYDTIKGSVPLKGIDTHLEEEVEDSPTPARSSCRISSSPSSSASFPGFRRMADSTASCLCEHLVLAPLPGRPRCSWSGEMRSGLTDGSTVVGGCKERSLSSW